MHFGLSLFALLINLQLIPAQIALSALQICALQVIYIYTELLREYFHFGQ